MFTPFSYQNIQSIYILNDKERVQGYLGEILDLSRQVVQSGEEFDIVKENLEELENTLLIKLENVKDKE